MNIDDMGDNPRVPDQPRDCHYWPDCACGPSSKCWLNRAEEVKLLPHGAFMIVVVLALVTLFVIVGVVLAIEALWGALL